MIGGSGDDTYFFAIGDGNDTIVEDVDIFGGFDELVITGYTQADMFVVQDFETGRVTLSFSATDSITFDAEFFGAGLEGIVFVNDP